MSVISQGELYCRRTERLQAFCDEVRRYMYNRCINEHVNTRGVEMYCNELFLSLARGKEFTFGDLLKMLNNDDFLDEVFYRYVIIPG